MYSYRVPRVYKLADRFDAVTIIPIINYVSRVLEIEKRKKERKKKIEIRSISMEYSTFSSILFIESV